MRVYIYIYILSHSIAFIYMRVYGFEVSSLPLLTKQQQLQW